MPAKYVATLACLAVLALFSALPAWADGTQPAAGGTPTTATAVLADDDSPTTAPATNPSKAEVLYLLTSRKGMTAQELIANEGLVRALGEQAYPALAEALDEATDILRMRQILRVMTNSDGDKKCPARAARRLLRRYERSSDPDANAIRIIAVEALGAMNRAEDRSLVLSMLDDDREWMRMTVLGFLPRMCSERDLDRVQASYARRLAKVDAAHIDTDPTLKGLRMTIDTLAYIPASARPTTGTHASLSRLPWQ